METTNYKVVDPIQNFNLRVQLLERKLSLEKSNISKSIDHVVDIKWSQQISSPRDLLEKFINHENNERFRKQNKELEEIIVKQFQNNVCIYTVVLPGYAIFHKNKNLINIQSRLPQSLLEQLKFSIQSETNHMKIIDRYKYQLPAPRVMNIINKDKTNPIETMFICVATGVSPELLKYKSINALHSHISYEEHVLCTIKLYKDSHRIEMSPGLSSYILESDAAHMNTSTKKVKDISAVTGENHVVASINNPSLFLDNETIKNAIERG